MLIRVCDLETTGHAPPAHGVCEIGWTDVVAAEAEPARWRVRGGYDALLVDPGRPITPQTSAVHHIIDEDVVGAPAWPAAAARMLAAPGGPIAALAAHSAKFERQWITDEMTGGLPFVCTYKCALRLWPEAPSHSNQSLRYWRRPEGLDRALAHVAHRAGPDSYVTAFHLRDMLAVASLEQLIGWTAEPALQVRCRFGKNRGMPWREVDDAFLQWVEERDFGEDVLFTVRHEMRRRGGERGLAPPATPRQKRGDELELPF